jgi:hypothetical protein
MDEKSREKEEEDDEEEEYFSLSFSDQVIDMSVASVVTALIKESPYLARASLLVD